MRLLALSLLVACSSPSQPAPRPPIPSPAAAPALTVAQRDELEAQAMAAYGRKDWATCAATFERAEDWYSAACCHALAGRIDPAFAALQRAIAGGFRDAAHLERDPDLTSLRADPRWDAARTSIAAQVAAYRASVNGELLDLYTADQADRANAFETVDWKAVNARDEERRKRVGEIVAAGEAKVADDYYHAAMVFQHGATPAEIRRANELALRAVALDPTHGRAKWLAAASEDRVLMYEKRPQKYGTQFTKRDGIWVLWEVDPTITDEQRAKWNVPSLAAAKARVAQMNAARTP